MREEGRVLVVEYRARPQRRQLAWLVAIAVFGALPVLWWLSWGSLALMMGAAFVTGVVSLLLFPMLSVALGRTTVRVQPSGASDGEPSFEIRATYGAFGAFNDSFVDTGRVVQPYVARTRRPRLFAGKYRVRATTDFEDGSALTLAQGFETEAQALFVADAIRQRLGIADAPVDADAHGSKLGESATLSWTLAQVAGPLLAGGLLLAGLFAKGEEGEPVGRLDLLDPAAVASFELEAGDEVQLRAAVEVNNTTSKVLLEDLYGAELAVRLVSPDGSSRSETCSMYAGVSFGESHSAFGKAGADQLVTDCRLTARASGRYELRGSVTWPPGLPRDDVTRAELEIRRHFDAE